MNTESSATPILDCQEPLPARKSRWIFWALWMTLMFTIPWVSELRFNSPILGKVMNVADLFLKTFFGTLLPPPGSSSWRGLALIFAAIYLTIMIHEIGHLLAGLAVRFKIIFLLVWPFNFMRTRRGFAVRLEKLFCIWGAVCMVPQGFNYLRAKLFIYGFAGPAANLLSYLILRTALPANVDYASSYVHFFLDSLANASLWVGVLNLIPFQAAGFQSDGTWMVTAVADDSKFLPWYAVFRLSAAKREGIRSRDFDPALIQQALAMCKKNDKSIRVYQLAFAWAADRDDVEAAAHYLEACLSRAAGLNKHVRVFLMIQAAFFQGWYRENAKRTAHWMKQLTPGAKRFPNVVRLYAEAAFAWAQGNHTLAYSTVEEALVAAYKLPDTPQRDLVTSDLTEWQQKMKERLVASDCKG